MPPQLDAKRFVLIEGIPLVAGRNPVSTLYT
jgi:hypothetical protein